MSTIFPREERANILFQKILENEEACKRLTHTFYDELVFNEGDEGYLTAQQFVKALFSAYANRDMTAFLMAVSKNSMFDLLRNSFLAPFRFNEAGRENPIILTDKEGNLLERSNPGEEEGSEIQVVKRKDSTEARKQLAQKHKTVQVTERDLQWFRDAYQKVDHVELYFASASRTRHSYDPVTMDVKEEEFANHLGILLEYRLPDTVHANKTEAEAYAAVLDILLKLQDVLPRAYVFYGQDKLKDQDGEYDELGVFLPKHHFGKNFGKYIDLSNKIVLDAK